LVGSIVKGDMADNELGSDVSYMHLRRTTIVSRDTETPKRNDTDTPKRTTEKADMPTIIEKGQEEMVESPSPAKKSITKRFSSTKKTGILDGSVTDIDHGVSIFPATEIDG
jgi:hypothetical protein